MLVISRKDGDEVVIPQFDIVLKILEVRGNQVRIGIAAPPDVALYRREVWEQLQARLAVPETASGAIAKIHPQ